MCLSHNLDFILMTSTLLSVLSMDTSRRPTNNRTLCPYSKYLQVKRTLELVIRLWKTGKYTN